MGHPALAAGRVAVVTGAASGIGLAAARRFAGLGMRVCLADLPGEALDAAARSVAAIARNGAGDVLAVPADVGRPADLEALKAAVDARFGETAVLMNNAATRVGGGAFVPRSNWEQAFGVNLWGAMDGVRVFVPDMIASRRDGLVINVGSKQGITNPPGNTAYNVTKAALKAYTEALQHELRSTPDCRVTAHLLIPGFTFTGITGRAEKPADAWTAEQVIDFLLPRLAAGDFYILCPDNAVTRDMDNRRMRWAMEDVIQNRPALSRWHPDYKDAFAAFMRAGND
jgi:hypothetical protein